jgi:hypothetical protein
MSDLVCLVVSNMRARLFGALFLWSIVSAAEPTTHTTVTASVTAEQLFRDGRTLMLAGQQSEACPKFAESQRLDPAVGTLINLGVCYQEIGKTASAWLTLREAVLAAGHMSDAPRVAAIQERLDQLEPRLCRLRIDVKQVSERATVLLDDRVVERALIASGVPVDPGVHRLGVRDGQGYLRIEVPISAEDRLVFVPIGAMHPARAPAATAPQPEMPSQPKELPASAWNGRNLGLVAAGSGLVLGGVSGLFAWQAHRHYGDALSRCPRPEQCTSSTAMSMRREADTFDLVATSGFIVASTLLAAAGALYFWPPREKQPAVAVMADYGGAAASVDCRF